MRHRLMLLAVLAATALAAPVRAEKVDMSPEQLRETATHVITGLVNAIYARDDTLGDWKYTWYVAEIRVAECEKGDGIKRDDLVYARYWQRVWIGKGEVPPSTANHRGLPSTDEFHRIYLARNSCNHIVCCRAHVRMRCSRSLVVYWGSGFLGSGIHRFRHGVPCLAVHA
jgi:hypothetical protein